MDDANRFDGKSAFGAQRRHEIVTALGTCGVAVMAKASAPGRTKTRLVPPLNGDGADDPAAVADMVAALRSGRYDFVIGSRARGEREPASMASHQILAGLVAGALIGLIYGVRYTDMCAYRAIRRETLLALGMRELTYGWNLEMQMRVARDGLRVLELPVAYRRRIGGQSKVAGSLRGSLRAGSRIMATFARVAMEPGRRGTA